MKSLALLNGRLLICGASRAAQSTLDRLNYFGGLLLAALVPAVPLIHTLAPVARGLRNSLSIGSLNIVFGNLVVPACMHFQHPKERKDQGPKKSNHRISNLLLGAYDT